MIGFDLGYQEVDFDLEFVYRVTDLDSGYQEVDFNLEFVYRVTDLDSGYQEVDFDLEFYRVTDLVAINRLR